MRNRNLVVLSLQPFFYCLGYLLLIFYNQYVHDFSLLYKHIWIMVWMYTEVFLKNASVTIKDMNYPGSNLHQLKGRLKRHYSVKVCPVGNITLPEGRAVWNKGCQMCFACINLCPVTSIQYGNRTQGLKWYRNPGVAVKDIDESYRLSTTEINLSLIYDAISFKALFSIAIMDITGSIAETSITPSSFSCTTILHGSIVPTRSPVIFSMVPSKDPFIVLE